MVSSDLLRNLAVRPGPTGRYLERAVTGVPFVLQADTAWELFHRLLREEVIEYLDCRKSQGFNAVLAVALPELDAKPLSGTSYGPDGSHVTETNDTFGSKRFYPNRYGEVPLVNDDPNTPNEIYFKHVDWVVEQAAQRGILLILVPTWARYINRGWQGGPLLFDNQSAFSFGAFLGARYPFLPKILGGDSNPVWTEPTEIWKRFRKDGRKPGDEPVPSVMDLPRYEWFDMFNAMATGITRTELPEWGSLGSPLLTYHPTALWLPWSPEAIASTFFGDQPWLTLDGCQSGHADYPNIVFDPSLNFWNARASHVALGKMWSRSPTRPSVDLESHYEDMYNGLNPASGRKWSGDDIRSGAWQSVLSGACGVVYGTNAVWQMFDSQRAKTTPQMIPVCGLGPEASWRVSLDLPGPKYLQILSRFFASLPAHVYHHLQPAQEFLVSSSAPASVADLDGRVDVMRDAADEGGGTGATTTILIAHSGSGFQFELDLLAAFGSYTGPLKAAWLDPRTGEETQLASIERGNVVRFVPPSSGSAETDWVLVVGIQQ